MIINCKDDKNRKSNTHYRAILSATLVLLAVVFIAAISVGRYSINFSTTIKILLSNIFPIKPDWDGKTAAVIMTLRLPRSIAAILIGGALELSGSCYQSIFKNPMVSPDILGVSSGACVGAALAILLDLNSFYIQIFAFICGIITVFLTTLIPRIIQNDGTTVLVLSGVIMSSLMSSIMSIIKYMADTDTKLAEITYWMMGSLASIGISDIVPMLPTLLIPAAIILAMRFRLNVMSLGDREAQSLGIDLRKTRGIFVICATLLTASCVCLAGTIGWVGLVIPHISRFLTGADHKKMLPVAMLSGSIFMLFIDTLCRTLSSAELKIGILTGIIGAPFFFFILFKQRKTIS